MPRIWIEECITEEREFDFAVEEPRIAAGYVPVDVTLNQLNWMKRIREEYEQLQAFLGAFLEEIH